MKEDTFSLKHHIFLPFARMEVPKSYKVKSYKLFFALVGVWFPPFSPIYVKKSFNQHFDPSKCLIFAEKTVPL